MEHQVLASVTIYLALGVMTGMIIAPICIDISDHFRHKRTINKLQTELATKIKCNGCSNYIPQKEMFDLTSCIDCFELHYFAQHSEEPYNG